jgi:hypothetical protein
MSLRKVVGLLAGFALAVGLIGAGVGAVFTDSVTAQENINVGTFQCKIIAATPSAAALSADGKSLTYTAPTIMSSAAGTAPFSFTVQNTGTIADVLTVSTSPVSAPWSIIGAPFVAVPLAAGGTHVYSTGVSWTALDNSNLDAHGTVTWTVNCGEVPAPFTLYGDATVANGAVQLSTDGNGSTASYGSVDFPVPAGLTIGTLNTLSTNYQVPVGICVGGSPRFAIDVWNGTATKTIQVLLGNQWNNLGPTCPGASYMGSGNVLGAGYGADTTQINSGYVAPGAWATFQSSYGAYPVTGIRLVVDNGVNTPITALFNSVNINGTTITF